MAVVTDLINHSVDKKPSEFASTFDEFIKDRVATAIANKKVELSQALFGAPEVDDEEQPELELDQDEGTPTEDEIEDGDKETTPTKDD
jgi:hypothetical protein